MGFSTDCIHAGQEPEPATGAIATPIFQTSTFVQQGVGDHKGYEYARTGNPTRRALELNLAALEKGEDAYCFASGMAATQAVFTLLEAGDSVLVSDNLYGGSHRLFDKVLAKYGISFTLIDTSDTDRVAAYKEPYELLWIETPTNPLMKVCDIEALAEIAHGKGALLAVDNTFMSPYFQRPLGLGADIVVHSTTKFINGHSDSIGGVAVVRAKPHAEWLQYVQNAAGAILSPFDSWLTLRGVKTLALRMQRHEENSVRIASFLREQPKLRRVLWPGFEDHPGHAVQKRQASGFGALITFDVGDGDAANRFLKALRLCSLAESLGGVETLISNPARMTHAAYTQAERDAMGISDGLVRISVGVEEVEDLVADLERGLAAL